MCLRYGIAEKQPLCMTVLMQSQRRFPLGGVSFFPDLHESVSHRSSFVRSGAVLLCLRRRVAVWVPMWGVVPSFELSDGVSGCWNCWSLCVFCDDDVCDAVSHRVHVCAVSAAASCQLSCGGCYCCGLTLFPNLCHSPCGVDVSLFHSASCGHPQSDFRGRCCLAGPSI